MKFELRRTGANPRTVGLTDESDDLILEVNGKPLLGFHVEDGVVGYWPDGETWKRLFRFRLDEPEAENEHEYRVRWEIDLSATSPTQAAQKALRTQRDPNSIATVFEVVERVGHNEADWGLAEDIDLTNPEDQ